MYMRTQVMGILTVPGWFKKEVLDSLRAHVTLRLMSVHSGDTAENSLRSLSKKFRKSKKMRYHVNLKSGEENESQVNQGIIIAELPGEENKVEEEGDDENESEDQEEEEEDEESESEEEGGEEELNTDDPAYLTWQSNLGLYVSLHTPQGRAGAATSPTLYISGHSAHYLTYSRPQSEEPDPAATSTPPPPHDGCGSFVRGCPTFELAEVELESDWQRILVHRKKIKLIRGMANTALNQGYDAPTLAGAESPVSDRQSVDLVVECVAVGRAVEERTNRGELRTRSRTVEQNKQRKSAFLMEL
ncbi:hypothetical protein Cgig2_018045 [Carnegiea gigantea]|uniref:Uncharacterized protein n=1 Tax=Carnegiea gigantea TaxID=171969 RepID=A0A9Q1GKL7_9CARY|nr:hypothetical protein Cgig2_018045 [Carnegiea gigantea]